MFWQTIRQMQTIFEELFSMRKINVLFRKICLRKVKLKLAKIEKFPSKHHQQHKRYKFGMLSAVFQTPIILQ